MAFKAQGELKDALFKACDRYIETAFDVMTPKVQNILYKTAKQQVNQFYLDYSPKRYHRTGNLKKAAPTSPEKVKVNRAKRNGLHTGTFTAEISPNGMQEVYKSDNGKRFPKIGVFNQAIGMYNSYSLHGGKFLWPFIFGNTSATASIYNIYSNNSTEFNRSYGERRPGESRGLSWKAKKSNIIGTPNPLRMSPSVASRIKSENELLNSSGDLGGFNPYGSIHRAVSQACNSPQAIQVLIEDVSNVYIDYIKGWINNG